MTVDHRPMLVNAVAPSFPLHSPREIARLRGLVDDFWRPIGRILRSLGVPEPEIEDGLQQVYVVASAKLLDIEQGKESAFLVQVAVNVAARYRRARARSRETLDADATDAVAANDPSAEDNLDRERALALLNRALDRLDEDLRAVFVLYEIEEMTMAEISLSLDVPSGTVASRLRRARVEFKHAVDRLRPAGRS